MSPPDRSPWFDRAIEGVGWSAAAVALLLQNPYGELGPEADRFLVLQALALVASILAVLGAARQQKEASRHPGHSGVPALRGLATSPIARWALALGGAGALATALSVDPLRSLFGAPPRLFGFASELALLLLFFLLVPRLATVDSRERWETAVLAATGALVAYALLQWAGLDPLRWQVDWQGRPTAAQGNPLFLAQALAWLVPIALGRAVCRWRAGELRAAASAAALAILAGAVLVRTGARGPLLGLAVAVVVFAAVAGLGSPVARRRRAGMALAGLLGLALVAGAWVALQRADRLSGTASQRLLLWGSVVRLFEASPPLRLGSVSERNRCRSCCRPICRPSCRSASGVPTSTTTGRTTRSSTRCRRRSAAAARRTRACRGRRRRRAAARRELAGPDRAPRADSGRAGGGGGGGALALRRPDRGARRACGSGAVRGRHRGHRDALLADSGAAGRRRNG